ncbi:endonuclease-reverse transcriptase [Brachionus plicatilis]|uniref:Endonuclease-reverse transcriptase n=1 Tax=Brachionus plicatilis TaxID=10195 RepID=A0A3M7R2B5_BRAPC|nr:endonuclease-reverse transcriptase [Brachionus plicatilis]
MTLSNADLYRMTNSEQKNKRLRWLGHVLRMKDTRIPKRALQWTPQGRRKVGRPAVTWRSKITKELIEIGMTWGEARVKAKDGLEWKSKNHSSRIKRFVDDPYTKIHCRLGRDLDLSYDQVIHPVFKLINVCHFIVWLRIYKSEIGIKIKKPPNMGYHTWGTRIYF